MDAKAVTIASGLPLLALGLATGAASWAASWASVQLPRFTLLPLALLALWLASVYFLIFLFYRAFLAAFPLKAGSVGAGSWQETVANVHILFFLNFLNVLIRPHLLPVPLSPLLYRALGARMGRNSFCAGTIHDPALVTIGSDTMIGDGALLIPHLIEDERFEYHAIRLGDRVTVGARAIVLPGVQISDGASVAAGAVVSQGTVIGPNEIWGGIPARLIRKK